MNQLRRVLKICCLFLPCLLCACGTSVSPESSSAGANVASYTKISAEQAKEKLEIDAELILLDVRTEEEYKEKRINGAFLIPDMEIAERAEKELPDKDAVILVYCRSGRRSALSAQVLANMGYSSVFDFGGIMDWPYETVSG